MPTRASCRTQGCGPRRKVLVSLLITLAVMALVALIVPVATLARASTSDPRATAPARAIIVASDGSDLASGSLRHPLATIQAAISRLRHGGTVEIRGGYYAQRVVLRKVSGITLRPYRREHVILDGTNLRVPQGMSGMVEIQDSSNVTVEGLDITGYRTSSKQSSPVGIYVHGGDTAIVVRGNHIHDMGEYSRALGNFDYNALGIAVYGDDPHRPVRNLVVEDNTVDHMKTGASETVTLNGNVTHWRVAGNQIFDDNNIGIDAIGFEPTLSGRYQNSDLNRARDGVIADNIIHHVYSSDNPAYRLIWKGKRYWCNCDDGIYVDGGTHIVIERNTVYRTDIGIEVASEHAHGSASHIDVRDNFVWASKAVGISTGGYCDNHTDCGGGGLARPGSPVQTGQAFDNQFVNNTLFDNNTLHNGGPQLLLQYYVHDSLIEDNIVIAGPGQSAVLGTAPRAGADGRNHGNTVADNLYFSAAGDPATATFGWMGRTYPNLQSYQAHTGQDLGSRFIDPDLSSLSQPNLHLTAASPAINAGHLLPGSIEGATDIDGQSRTRGGAVDIGADEFTG